jgi:hypothetical protein
VREPAADGLDVGGRALARECGTFGSTPTTVWGRSFMSNTWPTMVGSPPNFVCQYE